MTTLQRAPSARSVTGLLDQLHMRDQKLAALQRQLEDREKHIKTLEEVLDAAKLAATPQPAPLQLQIFWLNGETFTESHSTLRNIPRDGLMREHLLELPPRFSTFLRIDPGAEPAFWDIEYLGLHPINDQQAISTTPSAVCTRVNAFAGLAIAGGALLLPGPENVFSLFSTSNDPQLIWKLPGAVCERPAMVKIRCRARNCTEGFLQSTLLGLGQILDANARPLREELFQMRREICEIRSPAAATVGKPQPTLLRRIKNGVKRIW